MLSLLLCVYHIFHNCVSIWLIHRLSTKAETESFIIILLMTSVVLGIGWGLAYVREMGGRLRITGAMPWVLGCVASIDSLVIIQPFSHSSFSAQLTCLSCISPCSLPLPASSSTLGTTVNSQWESVISGSPGTTPLEALCLSLSSPPSAQASEPVMHVAPACLDTDVVIVPKQAEGQ